ncbi:MAG: hypothetical protein ACYC1Q_13625, partial [Bacteroidia bacterium]
DKEAVNNWVFEGRELKAERAGDRESGGDRGDRGGDRDRPKSKSFGDRGGDRPFRGNERPAGDRNFSNRGGSGDRGPKPATTGGEKKSYGKDFYFPDFDSAHKKASKSAKSDTAAPKKRKRSSF